MKVLYFDCFSGISGDMTLGALLDAGLPLEALREAFGSLAIEGVHGHQNHHAAPSTKHPAPSTKHPALSTLTSTAACRRSSG